VEEKAMKTMCFVLCDHSGGGAAQDGSELTFDVCKAIAAAIAKQLNGEFAIEWGGSYAARVGNADGSDVLHDQGEVEVAIFQNEDVSGAAGYHDRDPKGHPYIHVALDDAASLTNDPSGGLPLSGVISHECCETAGDPGANRWADRAGGVEEALELCDRVEDTFYAVDGIFVSNFLLKSAFDPGAAGPWDRMNVLKTEDDQTPGGYVIERQQGTETSASAEGLTIRIGRRVTAHRDAPITDTFRRRKSHPASRTSRRGATVS
jgi:hypothetical protein